ncbi:hypothetical protein AcV5_001822 [Taiwanofungus camphoratus]|nr:hypothetical protein AcV5_001822 [Antrodia cinnamomea]
MIAPPASSALSPAQTLVDGRVPQRFSAVRRYVLLMMFCFAQFLDTVNNCALFSAIPSLEISLGIIEGQSTWIISAFQLTFASFLLISGRISDVYNPKVAFIGGICALGIICIGAGFVKDKITIIILRAFSGIAAAMTIPSALTLLVNVFVEPTEQARAIGIFGGCGAVGNVLGFIIGGIFVEYASWHWVFWFVAMVAFPIAGLCILLIPPDERVANVDMQGPKWKSLDLIGISILTAALILFIFALTSGSTDGWGSAMVLAPLIISIFMVVGFFYYETRIPPSRAAVPPRTWFLPNFSVLFGTALLPYFWWTTIFSTFTTLWQDVYHWSAISTAIHIVLSFSMSFTGPLSRVINPKWIILPAECLLMAATVLLALADGPDKYWSFVFPAFVVGSGSCMLTYTHTNIAIFRTSPASMAGTVGAIFNGALQLGSAVGIAVIGSIETSVQKTHGGPDNYAGYAAAFWFLLGVVGLEFIAMLVFYRTKTEDAVEDKTVEQKVVDVQDKLGLDENTGGSDVKDKKIDALSAHELDAVNEIAVSPV